MASKDDFIIVKNIFPKVRDNQKNFKVVVLAKTNTGYPLKIIPPQGKKIFKSNDNVEDLYISAIAIKDRHIQNCSFTLKLLMKENEKIKDWPIELSIIKDKPNVTLAWALQLPTPSGTSIPKKIYIKIGEDKLDGNNSNIIKNNFSDINPHHYVHGRKNGQPFFKNLERTQEETFSLNGLKSLDVWTTEGKKNGIRRRCSFALRLSMKANIDGFKSYQFKLSLDKNNKEWTLKYPTNKKIAENPPKNINVNVGDDNQ
jgi:hypothetical protein